MSRVIPSLTLALLTAYGPDANGASPVEAFERVGPAVVALDILDPAGKPRVSLTAIALSQDHAVTLCDALDGAPALRITTSQGPRPATVAARDGQRNLCPLAVAGLDLPALPLAADAQMPPTGARVHAISNALGLGIGISEGVVSGTRSQSAVDYIQFSAPVSPGSTGGALVDAEGRLLGIINYRHRDGQNVNFALPARRLAGIEQQDEAEAWRWRRWMPGSSWPRPTWARARPRKPASRPRRCCGNSRTNPRPSASRPWPISSRARPTPPRAPTDDSRPGTPRRLAPCGRWR